MPVAVPSRRFVPRSVSREPCRHRRRVQARALVIVAATLLSIPFLIGIFATSNFYVAMAMLFFEYLLAENWFGPAMSLLQAELPLDTVGFGAGLFAVTCTVVRDAARLSCVCGAQLCACACALCICHAYVSCVMCVCMCMCMCMCMCGSPCVLCACVCL